VSVTPQTNSSLLSHPLPKSNQPSLQLQVPGQRVEKKISGACLARARGGTNRMRIQILRFQDRRRKMLMKHSRISINQLNQLPPLSNHQPSISHLWEGTISKRRLSPRLSISSLPPPISSSSNSRIILELNSSSPTSSQCLSCSLNLKWGSTQWATSSQ